MYCEHCGTKLEKDAEFCQSCGKPATPTAHAMAATADHNPAGATTGSTEAIIKCGNCSYEGPGEKARNVGSMILAWLCIFFAPLITLIYFAVTHKYRCPKCKSTFLGIKNKEGVFVGQKGGAKSPLMIFVWVLVGIAIIGILSSIVLASLNTAREKAKQAQEQSTGLYK
jgi:RNA polymerase subunit RPABC4/transcription elongation factor Spt4